MDSWGVRPPGTLGAMASVLDLPDAPGPARDALVLQYVLHGDAEYSWVPLVVNARLTIFVMPDALKLGGVRIGAGAGLAQQIADALGAMLLTPKILDLMFAARAVTIPPELQYDATQMLTTHWFVKESARIDAALAAAGDGSGIIQTVGKPWMLTNLLNAHPGKACNYGWHVPPGTVAANKWEGTPAYASQTLPGIYVLQQPSYAHALDEADYSEMVLLMHQTCTLDGESVPMSKVLTNPALASMVSQEGVLTVPGLRQPGVPIVAPIQGLKSPGMGSVIVTALLIAGAVAIVA
jgi:hypothetical protein